MRLAVASRWKKANKSQHLESVQRWNRSHPQQRRCWHILEKAIRSGRIQRPGACQRCRAAGQVQGHHRDYSKPLDVVWLCRGCHGLLHRKDP